jgi:hypothetical protein
LHFGDARLTTIPVRLVAGRGHDHFFILQYNDGQVNHPRYWPRAPLCRMSSQDASRSRKRRRMVPETGPFVLRSLLEDVPLSAEGDRNDIEINCVEFLGMYCFNLAVTALWIWCGLHILGCLPAYTLWVIQIIIFTSELQLLRSCISYKYLLTRPNLLESPPISWHQDFHHTMLRHPHQRGLAYNRYFFFLELIKHAFSVTGQLPFTLYQS